MASRRKLCFYRVQPRVDLLNGALFWGAIAVLDDSLHVTGTVADDPAVSAGVRQGRGDQAKAGSRMLRTVDEITEEPGWDERTVAVENDQATSELDV